MTENANNMMTPTPPPVPPKAMVDKEAAPEKPSVEVLATPAALVSPMKDDVLHVVEKGEFKDDKLAPRCETSSVLYLTVMGKTFDDAGEPPAKNFAYQARRNFGFDQAGIEYTGSPFPVDANGVVVESQKGVKAEIKGYCRTFRIKRSIGTALP